MKLLRDYIRELLKEKKRVPRKKGQRRNSPNHSDLFTDENPKGTIKGLKFATVKDAEASVNKIKRSGKSHAHKTQAAIAMEQRAKSMGKKSAAAVYRKFINQQKEKTAKKNESVADRRTLTESAVHPKIMRMIDEAEEAGFTVLIQPNRVIIFGPDGPRDHPRAKINFEKDTSNGPCLNGAYVTYAKAEGGFGPLAYDVAIEATGGLMSDRSSVSPAATAVWDYYSNSRPDVKVDQLDILDDYLEPQLTPDDKSDDCDQRQAYNNDEHRWHTSPLSKKYSKAGTPVIDELRKRGMIKE